MGENKKEGKKRNEEEKKVHAVTKCISKKIYKEKCV